MLKKLLRAIQLAVFGADEAVCSTCEEDLQEATPGYAEWHAQGCYHRAHEPALVEKPF
jgi:hypothetical protein